MTFKINCVIFLWQNARISYMNCAISDSWQWRKSVFCWWVVWHFFISISLKKRVINCTHGKISLLIECTSCDEIFISCIANYSWSKQKKNVETFNQKYLQILFAHLIFYLDIKNYPTKYKQRWMFNNSYNFTVNYSLRRTNKGKGNGLWVRVVYELLTNEIKKVLL